MIGTNDFGHELRDLAKQLVRDECVDKIILPPTQRRRRSRNSQSLFDSLHARVGACS